MRKKKPIERLPATRRNILLAALKCTKRPLSRNLLMLALKGQYFGYPPTAPQAWDRDRTDFVQPAYTKVGDMTKTANGGTMHLKKITVWYPTGNKLLSTYVSIQTTDRRVSVHNPNARMKLPSVRIEYGGLPYAESYRMREVIGWTKLKKYLIPLRTEYKYYQERADIDRICENVPQAQKWFDSQWGQFLSRNHLYEVHLAVLYGRYTDDTTPTNILTENDSIIYCY